MTSLSVIPEADTSLFAKLPDKARQEVLRWHADMVRIDGAGHGLRESVIARVASERGKTASGIREKYDRWKKQGWRALAHASKLRGSTVLPRTFIEFWRGLVESYQREKTTVKAAHRALIARLDAWHRRGGARDCEYAIPGYDAVPRRMRSTGLPAGWDYNTLLGYAPDKAARALRSRGMKAYSTFLPAVRASREGVECGQVIFFDDEQPDVLVNFTGRNREAMRPLGFHALDYVSACNVMRGWMPQMRKEDGGKSALTETAFYWFVLGVLTRYGYRADVGTTLVAEMGTAKIGEAFAQRIYDATGGKVTADHSGRYGDPAFRGMLYEGPPGGNPRFKAPMETFFNLERNVMAMLPGQTGRNRDLKPDEITGLMRYDKHLLKVLETLPMERRMLLRMPVLEWGAFMRHADFLIDQVINRRTDHEIGEWERLGFTVPVIRMGEQEVSLSPANMAVMTPEMQALTRMLVAQGQGYIRKLSPAEVWQAGQSKMTRLKGWQIPTLMRPEDARIVKVTQRFELEIEDREIDAEPVRYIARVVGDHGHVINLKRGESYLCYLNPYAPGTLQVCEAGARAGAWLGEASMVPRVSRVDKEGLYRMYHEVQEATAPERADVERRAAAEVQRRTGDKSWNDRVKDLKTPLTPGEKRTAREGSDGEADLASIYAGPMGAEAGAAEGDDEGFDGLYAN